MIHRHHRKLRSQGGGDEPENILELEDWVHAAVHANVALAIEYGLLVPSWDNPADVPVDLNGFLALFGGALKQTIDAHGVAVAMQTTLEGDEVPHQHVVDESGLEKECPRCHGAGKITEKPKEPELEPGPARPKTTVSIRVPKDRREDGAEVIRGLWAGTVDLLIEAGMLRSSKGADYFADCLAHVFFQQNFDPSKGYDQ